MLPRPGFKIQGPYSLSQANPPPKPGSITMATLCNGQAVPTLACLRVPPIQLMLSLCEHWRMLTKLSVAINEMLYVTARGLQRRGH